ncbi:Uncharacterised protein [Capnocytophaga ochracea]|uniref:Uncharacterized protein n=1 Tax=Capnocytophaga ochracea TaxID=1018 RepID=A0A2X2TPZ3_CAPOC|nr:Uncharacterised protein [Capnocytophaga ochracea]
MEGHYYLEKYFDKRLLFFSITSANLKMFKVLSMFYALT